MSQSTQDPTALAVTAMQGDAAVLRRLHRKVFPRLHGRSPAFDAIYVGITLSEREQREQHLTNVLDAIRGEDEDRLRELTEQATWWSVPTGYSVDSTYIGSGKTSRVALIRRDSDGVKMAWKIPANDSVRAREELVEQVERSRAWHELGASDAVLEPAQDGLTVLQPFIKGPMLHEILSDHRLQDQDALRQALVTLLAGIITGRTFISGLNPRNFVHDGTRWHIIDSGSVQRTRSVGEAFGRQRKDARSHWTRWTKDSGDDIELVFDEVHREVGLARTWLLSYHAARLLRRVGIGPPKRI